MDNAQPIVTRERFPRLTLAITATFVLLCCALGVLLRAPPLRAGVIFIASAFWWYRELLVACMGWAMTGAPIDLFPPAYAVAYADDFVQSLLQFIDELLLRDPYSGGAFVVFCVSAAAFVCLAVVRCVWSTYLYGELVSVCGTTTPIRVVRKGGEEKMKEIKTQ